MGHRFVIVEDDEMIRAAVAGGLRLDGHVVDEAGTLAQAREMLGAARPDLLLLDVGLPDGNGLELMKELRERERWDGPIVVLTARGTEEDRVLGFEHGCDDYVVKPFSLRELRLRIDALLRRVAAPAARTTADVGGRHIDLAAHRVQGPDGETSLSPRELQMLLLFLEHPGEVLSRERFLQEVWGYDRAPVTRTVDMHVRKLREKLEPSPEQPRHFVTVHGAGYRFDP